jgi:hypothetical protein
MVPWLNFISLHNFLFPLELIRSCYFVCLIFSILIMNLSSISPSIVQDSFKIYIQHWVSHQFHIFGEWFSGTFLLCQSGCIGLILSVQRSICEFSLLSSLDPLCLSCSVSHVPCLLFLAPLLHSIIIFCSSFLTTSIGEDQFLENWNVYKCLSLPSHYVKIM